MKTHRAIALFSLLLLVFLVDCQAPQHRYAMTGEIITIDRATHELIIHNDDIPNYMKAMTMPFQVKNPAVLDHLQPGQRIKATLIATGTNAWLEDIQLIFQDETKPAISSSEFKTPVEGAPVPDFVFINQDGQRVHLAQYKGKVVLLTFIYTRCPMPDFCPRMTNNFLAVEKSLKNNSAVYSRTHLLSITFDPEFDTSKVLREHALSVTSIPASELFSHWEFLTPNSKDLDSIARFFGLSTWKENGQITHSLSTAVIDRDGKLYRWYHGNSWTPDELVREAKTAAGGT